jgi:hypothetical protein
MGRRSWLERRNEIIRKNKISERLARLAKDRRRDDVPSLLDYNQDEKYTKIPSFWGRGAGFIDDVYFQTDPNAGGLEYPDAVDIVKQVKEYYCPKVGIRHGKHLLVRGHRDLSFIVELGDDGIVRLARLKRQDGPKYGKTDNPEEVVDYIPATIIRRNPPPNHPPYMKAYEWRDPGKGWEWERF